MRPTSAARPAPYTAPPTTAHGGEKERPAGLSKIWAGVAPQAGRLGANGTAFRDEAKS